MISYAILLQTIFIMSISSILHKILILCRIGIQRQGITNKNTNAKGLRLIYVQKSGRYRVCPRQSQQVRPDLY